jgi:polyisoprenoid-binding protein YceI
MKRIYLLGLAMLAVCSTTALAHAQTSTWSIDPAHSSADFVVRHLGVSNVHGMMSGIAGTLVLDEKDITKSSVTAAMDANTISTSEDARDKDLKSPNFFDVIQFPTLTFKSTSIQRVNGKLEMLGNLTLHGVTKPITLEFEGPAPAQKGMGGKIVSGFSATGILHRSDFNFGAKYPSPMIGDDVKLSIDVEIDKRP